MSDPSSARTVLLIVHAPPRAPDTASRTLQRLGYDLHWVCPARGDRIPPVDRRYAAAIVFGGNYAATETRRFPFMAQEADWVGDWLNTGRPFLGLGLGAQVLAHQLGARIAPHPDGLSEIGWYTLDPTPEGLPVFPERMTVAQWHFLGFDLPDATTLLATSGLFENQAFRFAENAFGFQFHPEISLDQHELWLEEETDMTTIPGAQDIFTQRQLADVYHSPMRTWFENFLALWIRGAVPETY